MNKDLDVLKLLANNGGHFIWDKNQVRWIGTRCVRVKAPESILHRLTEQGYVEVAVHNISVWKYGPKDHVSPPGGYNAQLKRNVAILDELDEPTWRSRTEIHAKLTVRGTQHCVNMGLLD